MSVITPIKHIRAMEVGRSSPQLMLFSDNERYVVKFKNNQQGNWVLINEYVVNKLARLLKLPVPKYKTVRVSDQFIGKTKILRNNMFHGGHQVGFRYISHSSGLNDITPLPDRKYVKNRRHAAGVIVFDHWVSNKDRGLRNLLLQRDGNHYYLRMIDHANCFGQPITENDKSSIKVRHCSTYKFCLTLIQSRKELDTYVNKIKAIPNEAIKKIIDSLPSDWNVAEKEKVKLYKYLLRSQKRLQQLINEYIALHATNLLSDRLS